MDCAFDRVGEALQGILRHRALTTRDLEAAHQFVAIERLPPLIALHDDQRDRLDLFVTREAAIAARALAPAADDVSLPALARVDDAIFHVAAERAAHSARRISQRLQIAHPHT